MSADPHPVRDESAQTPAGVVDSTLPTDTEGWTRMHPLSPAVRSWAFILIAAFTFGRGIAESFVNRTLGLDDDTPADASDGGVVVEGVWAWTIAVGVVLLVATVFVLSWWFTRFRLEEEQISLREGWLFRKRRQMRYDRIQAVDLQFPLLARIFGLAKVRIEAADGGSAALELIYLKRSRAEEARREILDQVAGRVDPAPAPAPGTDGSGPGPTTVAPRDPDEPAAVVDGEDETGQRAGLGATLRHHLLLQDEGTRMLSVPTGRLIGSVLLSPTVVTTVVAVAVVMGISSLAFPLLGGQWMGAQVISDIGRGVLIGSAVPVGFALIVSAWSQLNQGWNFTVFHTADGLRLTYGLTESNSQTVPPGRVQGMTVRQPLLWRPFGWYSATVMVAGYGGEGSAKRSVVLPVGSWEDVLRVLSVVAPDPGLDEDPRTAEGLTPARLMELAARGSGEEGGFRHIPRRAAWYFHWHTWRRNGFTTTPTLLVLRRGRLGRTFSVIAHERLEAVHITQGPVQRRLRTATVYVCLASRLVPLYADDLDEEVARTLFREEGEIAAVARRLKDRNQWMRPEELQRFNAQLDRMGQNARGEDEEPAAAAAGPGREA